MILFQDNYEFLGIGVEEGVTQPAHKNMHLKM